MAIRTGPLGYSFTGIRLLQFAVLVVICGICANLGVSVNRLDAPRIPHELLLSLVVSGVGMLYILTTLLLHLFGVFIKYLISSILDTLLFGALLAVAILVGRPLTNLSCSAVRDFNNNIETLGDVLDNYPTSPQSDLSTSSSVTVADAGATVDLRPEDILDAVPHGGDGLKSVWGLAGLGTTVGEVEEKLGDYKQWVGRVGRWCVLMKVVWALAILGCILMVAGGVVAFMLWRKTKEIPWQVEEEEGREKYYGGGPVEDQGRFDPSLGSGSGRREEPLLQETGDQPNSGYGEVQGYGNASGGGLRL